MKYTIFSVALTALVGLSQAAPLSAGVSEPRNYFEVQVTFQGAPPNVAFFTQSFPADGSFVQITNPLSISHIVSSGGATCSFKGVDGSNTVVVGAQTVDVGPPQTQIGGSCRAF